MGKCLSNVAIIGGKQNTNGNYSDWGNTNTKITIVPTAVSGNIFGSSVYFSCIDFDFANGNVVWGETNPWMSRLS